MRVLVCGGRDFRDRDAVFRALDEIHARTPIDTIIHGGASGADSLAAEWAHSRNVSREAYVPNWELHGKAAGPIRNQQMIDEGKPDMLVSFTGGKGTLDMVGRAKKAGIRHLAVGWMP